MGQSRCPFPSFKELDGWAVDMIAIRSGLSKMPRTMLFNDSKDSLVQKGVRFAAATIATLETNV